MSGGAGVSGEPPRTRLRVSRGEPGDPPRYDTYEVPYAAGTTVLDALLWVRRHLDPTLAVRFSCLNSNACKECVAVVNGKRGYLCTFRLTGEPVVCEPLSNKPRVRDLVVDIRAPGEEQPS